MKYFALLFLLIPIFAKAGGSRAGNGGDGVYCSSSSSHPQLQLLDFYELSFYENEKVELGDVNEDALVKVAKIIESFGKISPVRARRYKERMLEFSNRIRWSKVPLQDIPDSNHVVLPVGCEIRQLVVQSTVDQKPSYLVDQNLWQLLNGTQKAGLILHEIIYEEALEQGQLNSINTRELVRYFAKKKFAVIDDLNEFNRNLYKFEFYRLLEVAFENGDVALLSHYSEYVDVSHDELSSWKFCGYFLKATSTLVNHCEANTYEFQISGFEGNKKYAARQIYRIFSLTTGLIVFMVKPSDLNLNFPILDFHTGGFVPARDMSFENENFKTVCEKGFWAYLFSPLEFNYFELDENPVVRCGNPDNSKAHFFLKFDDKLYEYKEVSYFDEGRQVELVKPTRIAVGKNQIEIQRIGVSIKHEPFIFPAKKNLKIDLGKSGYCMVQSSDSKIRFLNDGDSSIEITLGGRAPEFDYCHVKFKDIEMLNASRVKVTKRGLGDITDAE